MPGLQFEKSAVRNVSVSSSEIEEDPGILERTIENGSGKVMTTSSSEGSVRLESAL